VACGTRYLGCTGRQGAVAGGGMSGAYRYAERKVGGCIGCCVQAGKVMGPAAAKRVAAAVTEHRTFALPRTSAPRNRPRRRLSPVSDPTLNFNPYLDNPNRDHEQ